MLGLGRVRRAISHRLSIHELASSVVSFAGGGTSITDMGRYPLMCYLASKDERTFSSFNRNTIYKAVLEHVTQKQGTEYLDVISEYGLLTSHDWQ